MNELDLSSVNLFMDNADGSSVYTVAGSVSGSALDVESSAEATSEAT